MHQNLVDYSDDPWLIPSIGGSRPEAVDARRARDTQGLARHLAEVIDLGQVRKKMQCAGHALALVLKATEVLDVPIDRVLGVF